MDTQRKIELYRKRQKIKKNLERSSYIGVLGDQMLVQRHLNSEVQHDQLNNFSELQNQRYLFDHEINVTKQEVEALLQEIHSQFDEEKLDNLIHSCKETVIDSIIKPFGLAQILFTDRDGGNVTTVHNFKKGVVTTDEDAKRYYQYQESQANFNRKEYENKDFKNKRRDILQQPGELRDAYTGKTIPKDGRSHLDHVVSAHEIDQKAEAHLFMNTEQRVDMANSDSNLVMTNQSLNQSKSDHDMDEWLNKTKEGKKNIERYDVDEKKAKQINQNSRKDIDKKLTKAQLKKQGTELAKTGLNEGLKMGLQQSMGLMMKEFIEAIFLEIKDIYNNGFKGDQLDQRFFVILKERLKRIGEKITAKWRDVVKAFGEGVFSVFISNLITTIVNTFVTTGKRVVRVIRDGFFSLLKAVKMLLSPPEGMTSREAAHEGSKLIASGIVLGGGILLEEGFEKFLLTTFVAPFANIISTIVIGLVTGLATVFAVYLLDKIDLFGVNRKERHNYMINYIDNQIKVSMNDAEESYQIFAPPKIIQA